MGSLKLQDNYNISKWLMYTVVQVVEVPIGHQMIADLSPAPPDPIKVSLHNRDTKKIHTKKKKRYVST